MLKEDQYKLLVPTQKRRKAWLGWCIWFCEHESFKNNSENEETLCNTAEQWFHLLKNATKKMSNFLSHKILAQMSQYVTHQLTSGN